MKVLLAALSSLLLLPLAAAADGLHVSPARIDISAARPVAVVMLTNTGAQPLAVQARALRWPSMPNALAPDATPIVVDPPIASIAPGSRQRVRIALLDRSTSSGAERSYRVHFTALPTAEQLDEFGAPTPLGASAGLPVAVLPADAIKPVQWRIATTAQQVPPPRAATASVSKAKKAVRVAKRNGHAKRRMAVSPPAAPSSDKAASSAPDASMLARAQ